MIAELVSFLSVFAQAETPTPAPGPFGGSQNFLFMLVMIGAAFYFIILRPQAKERKEREQQLNTVAKGDRIVTIGGLHGRVMRAAKDGKTVEVEIARNTLITLNRTAIASIVKKGKGKPDEGGNGGEVEGEGK